GRGGGTMVAIGNSRLEGDVSAGARAGRVMAGVVLAGMTAAPQAAHADEGGVSLWLPGIYGSFAALPGVPGWTLGGVYYHPSVSTGANAVFPRGGQIDLGVEGRADLFAFGPTYIFEEPFWGAQAALGVLVIAGRNSASV